MLINLTSYHLLALLALAFCSATPASADDMAQAKEREEQAITKILDTLRAPTYRDILFTFAPADAKDGTAGRVVAVSFAERLNGNDEIAQLPAFPFAKSLILKGDFDDEGLAPITKLKRVERLWVISRNVTDKGISQLAAMTSLKRLEFAGTAATGKCLDDLRPLRKLEFLVFHSMPITDDDVAKLKQFPKLKTLDLTSTKVTDEGLQHLLQLKELEYLGLGGLKLSLEGLRPLTKMPELKSLYLDGSGMRKGDAEELQKLNPKLEIIGR